MQTKVMCIGDQHFMVTNISEVDEFITKCLNYVKSVEPDFIVLLGDLLHTHERLHTVPLNRAHNFIQKLSLIAKVFVLVGNHDFVNNSQFLTEEHWLNGMKSWENVTIVDKITTHQHNGMTFTFSPYVFPGRFEEALNTIDTDVWLNSKCIFGHQEFRDCKLGSQISVDGDDWSLDKPFVISGHIHSNQRPRENIYYPGSPMEHSFGESQKNIIALSVFKTDEKFPEIIETDLQLPCKRLLYLAIDDMNDFIPPETKDKIKISVSGSYSEFKVFKKSAKYHALIASGIKIVFKETRNQTEMKNKMLKEAISALGETNFNDIIRQIVINEKDPYLYAMYEHVLNNKQVQHEDVIFL